MSSSSTSASTQVRRIVRRGRRNHGILHRLTRKVARINRVLKAEIHAVDKSNNLTPGTTVYQQCISNVAEGDSDGNRSGTTTRLKNLKFNYTIVPNASATAGDVCRFIIYRWKGPAAGGTPSSAYILESTSNVDSMYNFETRKNFQVLYDRKIDSSVQTGYKSNTIYAKIDKDATYTSTGANDWDSGHIFILVLFAQAVNTATFNFYSRVTFMP